MNKLLQKLIVLFVLCNFPTPSQAGVRDLPQNYQQAVLPFLLIYAGIESTPTLIDQLLNYFNPSVSTTASSSTSSSEISTDFIDLENTLAAFLSDDVIYSALGPTIASELLEASPVSLIPSSGGAFTVTREELQQLQAQSPEFATAIANALDGASVRLPINGLTLFLLIQTLGGWNDTVRAFVRNLSLDQVSRLSADIARFKLRTLRRLICSKDTQLPEWLILEIWNNPSFKVETAYSEPLDKLPPQAVFTVVIDRPLDKEYRNFRDQGQGKKLVRIVFKAPCTNCQIVLPNMDCVIEGENFEGTKFWTGSSQGENKARYYFKNKQQHPIFVRALGKVHAAHPSDIHIFESPKSASIHALHRNQKDQFIKDHCNYKGEIEIQIGEGLRKTQVVQLCDMFDAENKGVKYMTIEAATGSGKTRTMVSEVENNPGQTTLILTPRTDLVSQIANEFKQYAPGISVANSVDSNGSFATFASQSLKHNQVIVGTLQGFQASFKDKKTGFLKNVNKIIFDEAHYLFSKFRSDMIEEIKQKYPELQISFFTATPTGRKNAKSGIFSVYQLSGEAVSGPHHVKSLAIKDAIDAKVNTPFQVAYVKGLQTELQKADKTDFQIERTQAVISVEKHHAVVLDIYQNGIMDNNIAIRKPIGGRYGIVFCAGIKHAEELTDYLNEHGSAIIAHKQAYEQAIYEYFKGETESAKQFLKLYPYVFADLVHSELKDQDVKSRLLRNRFGGSTLLSGADKLIEGYDNPKISLVLLMNPVIKAISKSLQSVGRGERLDPNDPYKVTLAIEFLWDKRQVLLSSPQILGTMHHGTAPWTIEFEQHVNGVPPYNIETAESKSGTLELSKKRREPAKKAPENDRQTKRVRLIPEAEQENERLQEELHHLVTQLQNYAQTLSSYTLKPQAESLEMDVEGEKEWAEIVGDIVPNINVIDWDKGEMQVESKAGSEAKPGSSMIFDEASSPSVSTGLEMDAGNAISGVNDFFVDPRPTKKTKKTNSGKSSSRSPSPSPSETTKSIPNDALRSLIAKAKSAIAKAQNFVTGCQMEGGSSKEQLLEISSEVSDALGAISSDLVTISGDLGTISSDLGTISSDLGTISNDLEQSEKVESAVEWHRRYIWTTEPDAVQTDAPTDRIMNIRKRPLSFVEIRSEYPIETDSDYGLVQEATVFFKAKRLMRNFSAVQEEIDALEKIFAKFPHIKTIKLQETLSENCDNDHSVFLKHFLLRDFASLETVEFDFQKWPGARLKEVLKTLSMLPGLKHLSFKLLNHMMYTDVEEWAKKLYGRGEFKDLLTFNGMNLENVGFARQQIAHSSQQGSQLQEFLSIQNRSRRNQEWVKQLKGSRTYNYISQNLPVTQALRQQLKHDLSIAIDSAMAIEIELKKLRENFPNWKELGNECSAIASQLLDLQRMMDDLKRVEGSTDAFQARLATTNHNNAQMVPSHQMPQVSQQSSHLVSLEEIRKIKVRNQQTAAWIKRLQESDAYKCCTLNLNVSYDLVQRFKRDLIGAINYAEDIEKEHRALPWQLGGVGNNDTFFHLQTLRQMMNEFQIFEARISPAQNNLNNAKMAPSQQPVSNQATVNTNIPQTSVDSQQDSQFFQILRRIQSCNQSVIEWIKQLEGSPAYKNISRNNSVSQEEIQKFKQNLIDAINYANGIQMEITELDNRFVKPFGTYQTLRDESKINSGNRKILERMMDDLQRVEARQKVPPQQPVSNQAFGQPSPALQFQANPNVGNSYVLPKFSNPKLNGSLTAIHLRNNRLEAHIAALKRSAEYQGLLSNMAMHPEQFSNFQENVRSLHAEATSAYQEALGLVNALSNPIVKQPFEVELSRSRNLGREVSELIALCNTYEARV